MRVELYDTTLRDGAQGTGFSYSIEDRLRILHKLDQLGVPYVEGGWPGANPRDTEFFQLATRETLKHATLTAFGMTRRARERASESAVQAIARPSPYCQTASTGSSSGERSATSASGFTLVAI